MLDQCQAVAHLGEVRENAVDRVNVHLSNCSSSDDGVDEEKEGQELECFASGFVLVSYVLQPPSPHSSVFGSWGDIRERQCYGQIEDRAIP